MKNQYEVLGKAPGAEDLKKLSNENVPYLQINQNYVKFPFYHILRISF